MSNLANTFDAVARYALLQSTVIFLIGMLIARFAVRRPARVHTVLALAFLAAIVAPLASEAVRRGGWGVLPPEPMIIAKETTAIALPASKPFHGSMRPDQLRAMTLPGATEASATMVENRPPAGTTHDPASRAPEAQSFSSAIPAEPTTSAPTGVITIGGAVFATVALAWSIVSALLIGRLLAGVVAGRRILHSAARCDEPAVHAALAAARDRLGMNPVRVEVFQSSDVRCPMIWCWAARPQLLLPIDAARDWSAATWTPVLCHELAHWKRRDHWAALIAEVVCSLLPWQVLAWWAKRRLENASEQACDDWTVAVGHSAVDYAETLLGLVAQADPPLALAALRRRSGLAGRIQHILTQGMPHPRLGRLWAVAVLLFAVISIGVAAVCQRGVARADAPAVAQKKSGKSDETKSDDKTRPAAISPGKPAAAMAGKSAPTSTATPDGTPILPVAPDDASDEPETFRVVGKVITTDDKPIKDAEVYWDVSERPLSSGDEWPAPKSLSQTRTDAGGAFAMEIKYSRKRLANQYLVVRAAGCGLRAYQGKEFMGTPIQAMEIRLEPSVPIEGSIFTPDGVPVAGARVTLAGMYQGSDDKENWNGWHLSSNMAELKSEQLRAYWPAAVVTDAQGKFRMDDVTPRRATADLRIEAADYPATVVAVRHPESLPYNLEVAYRETPFMLVLEQPYVVNGRFLDETTGEPIANVRMESQPYSNNGNNAINNNFIKAVSDADGRYVMRVGSADLYFVKVFPPLGYPSVRNSISARQINQLAGADRTLDYVLKLRKGIVLKGRVVDSESGEGVAKAQVHYQLEKGRKIGVNNHFFPVVTEDDGTFEATAVDGKGFLLVDAPEGGFYRLAAQDDVLVELVGPPGAGRAAQRARDLEYGDAAGGIVIGAGPRMIEVTGKQNLFLCELRIGAVDPCRGKAIEAALVTGIDLAVQHNRLASGHALLQTARFRQ